MWEINGLSIEFDIEDLETAEKLDKALIELQKAEKSTPKGSTMAESIKIYCKTLENFFISIFGDETTKQIFSGVKINQRLYDEIFMSFCDLVDEQKIKREERSKRFQRYVPKK